MAREEETNTHLLIYSKMGFNQQANNLFGNNNLENQPYTVRALDYIKFSECVHMTFPNP